MNEYADETERSRGVLIDMECKQDAKITLSATQYPTNTPIFN